MALHDAKAQKWYARGGDAAAPGIRETATLPKSVSTSSSIPSSSLISSSASPTASSPAPSTAPSPISSVLYDLNISNGTCYYAPNAPMDPGFIPCGNAVSETKTCCWKGDVCLSDQACFGIHEGVYTTYMGGCTDENDTLTSNNCPQKPQPYSSEPWIGLAYCNGTSDEWIACPQEASPSVIKGAGPCVCPAVTQQRIVAFRDASVLPSYASLPTGLGGSIKWLGGYTPTIGTADATGAETGSSSSTRTDSPTAGSSRTPLIVGLSVGLSGIVLLALAGILSFCRKKRAQGEKAERGKLANMGEEIMDGGAGGQEGTMATAVARNAPKEAEAPQTVSTISELEMRPARPWSLRSELDGGYPAEIGSAGAGGDANAGANATADEGQVQAFSRMSSGRLSYGPLSPMTTGPSLAEALEVSTQMTGSSTVSAQTAAHTGQTADGQRRHPSLPAMQAMHDRRPPIATLVELE